MMTTTLLPQHGCPVCQRSIDAASDVRGDARPNPGDITICAYCASILEFDDEMRPQQASALTLSSIDSETAHTIEVVRRAVRDLRAQNNEGSQP